MEDEEDDVLQQQRKNKTVIRIPSFQEVLESSQSKTTSPSLFTPDPSFTQAFSFIKSSEFYSPPPPQPPPATAAPSSSQPTSTTPSTPSQLGQSNLHPRSSSSSASNSAPSRNAILVSPRQKGNPLLKHIRNVKWAFSEGIVCDYLLGQNSCALYLSLRYHLLHPDYLYFRIRELQKNFKLRVVLCHVDVEDVVKPLLEVTKTALLHDCTLLCAWSLEECGRYLETIKVYENKPADIIQGQMDTDYLSRLNHSLTAVRHVNKTDVVTLGSTFGSLSHIMDASMEDLARCPGIGERKVRRLYDTFHEPFKRVIASNPAPPEATAAKTTEPDSAPELQEPVNDAEETSKRRKKEPAVTVKSALATAFAKYRDKVGKRGKKAVEEKGKEANNDDDFVS